MTSKNGNTQKGGSDSRLIVRIKPDVDGNQVFEVATEDGSSLKDANNPFPSSISVPLDVFKKCELDKRDGDEETSPPKPYFDYEYKLRTNKKLAWIDLIPEPDRKPIQGAAADAATDGLNDKTNQSGCDDIGDIIDQINECSSGGTKLSNPS